MHPWYFLVLTLVFSFIAVRALQHNNIEMGRLRTAVFVADKEGGDVESALKELRHYVSRHMNTSLTSGSNGVHPPIQLKYTYERIQSAQQQALGQNNSAVYAEAQRTCNEQGQTANAEATITCIQNFMASRGIQLGNIPDALYKFDFMSPRWSPDLAGWSIVVAVLSFVGFAISALYHWLMKPYA